MTADLALRLQLVACEHCTELDLPHDLGLRLASECSDADRQSVRVRPLEWRDRGAYGLSARSLGGFYWAETVFHDGGDAVEVVRLLFIPDGSESERIAMPEGRTAWPEAVQAAQAHHAARLSPYLTEQ